MLAKHCSAQLHETVRVLVMTGGVFWVARACAMQWAACGRRVIQSSAEERVKGVRQMQALT